MVIPGLHLTLGIFLKIFKLFDQECRRFDYRLKRQNDEELEKILEDLFFKEAKIFNFEVALTECTNMYLNEMTNIADDDEYGRGELQKRFDEHRKKVETIIHKLVRQDSIFIYFHHKVRR